ncbi:MAG: HAD hydrolase family protein [Holophagales bacterium]|nr:HAD hydrolase family protein [Holophagales bacterium]
MPQHFRAVALDYDGTLTSTGRLDDTILNALRTLREQRLKLVLVTGRIPWELLELCPHAEELFDRIVWENGAVAWGARGARLLAPPVPGELEEALARRGVSSGGVRRSSPGTRGTLSPRSRRSAGSGSRSRSCGTGRS